MSPPHATLAWCRAVRVATHLVALALTTACAALALAACGAAPLPAPAPPAPEPVVAAPPAPSAAPAEPAALPFHMPCASDDPVGCTTGCEGGFVEDCVTLGVMYLGGATVTVDRERAVGLFQKACAADSARGCLLLGDAFHAGIAPAPAPGAATRDPHAEEVLYYRRACDGGANQGCVRAGRALAEGHGTGLDPAHAAGLFAPVCDRGNAEACLELGKLFATGSGVKKDAERALTLFDKACGLGLQEGCLRASPKGEARSPRVH